ncbi:hypothetical protein B7486_11410 [cyanobacterium TDX16]|nr:hypothetical protein B7486_11410 [cyanobacterium TDX16]
MAIPCGVINLRTAGFPVGTGASAGRARWSLRSSGGVGLAQKPYRSYFTAFSGLIKIPGLADGPPTKVEAIRQ